MSRRLKHLLLTTVEDPYDVKSWSGIPFWLRQALERQVDRLSVFTPSRPSRNPFDVALRLLHGGTPPRYPLWMTRATLRNNAREVKERITTLRPDAVLSISSQCIARLSSPGCPVFMFSDSPWMAWHEAYEGTVSRPLRMAWFAEQEALAARRIDGLCFGSEWAIDQARRLYGDTVAGRLHMTPMGANWVPAGSRDEVLGTIARREDGTLHLLYVGKDWERKGGPLAVEIATLLHAAGHRVQLDIVGCRPQLPPATAAFITVHGLLYQSDPEQSATLSGLFERAHFLVVPTLAECFGIVFAEAQAFALPPVSRAVHALPTVVKDGVTGLLFEPSAPASAYVERILALRADPAAYRRMATHARDRFESMLNWDETAGCILDAIERTLQGELR